MAPKPWCSAEARTPQHGETAWLWGAGDFRPAGSCSPLTQCQPSSDCKCTRDPKPSKQVLHFLSHRNCEIMKIIAVLSTANDVLVDFFKDNSRLSRKKKKNPDLYLLSPWYKFSHSGQRSATTVEAVELGGDAAGQATSQACSSVSSCTQRQRQTLCSPKWSPWVCFKAPSPVYVIEPRALWYSNLWCLPVLRGHIRTPHLTASSPNTEKCSGGSPSPSKG